MDAANETGSAVKKREDTHKWLKLIKLLHITDINFVKKVLK